MDTVDLGGARLHVLPVWPGLPGEAERVTAELNRLDPAIVLADADTADGLRLAHNESYARGAFEPTFVDGLLADECARRFSAGKGAGEHPLLATARAAHRLKASFIVMRPATRPPGIFARRRARKVASALESTSPEWYARAYANALVAARAWDPAEDAANAMPRVERALSEGRAPVAAVVQAHRAEALLAGVRGLGRLRA